MEKDEINEIGEEIKKIRIIPKKVRNEINTKIFINIMIAIVIMVYFYFLSFGYFNIRPAIYIMDLKVFSIFILALAILLFEEAYRREDGRLAIHGIETLILAMLTVYLPHIYLATDLNYIVFTILLGILFAAYYVLKSIIIDIREINRYKREASDIKEIIKRGNKVPEKYHNKSEGKQDELEVKLANEEKGEKND